MSKSPNTDGGPQAPRVSLLSTSPHSVPQGVLSSGSAPQTPTCPGRRPSERLGVQQRVERLTTGKRSPELSDSYGVRSTSDSIDNLAQLKADSAFGGHSSFVQNNHLAYDIDSSNNIVFAEDDLDQGEHEDTHPYGESIRSPMLSFSHVAVDAESYPTVGPSSDHLPAQHVWSINMDAVEKYLRGDAHPFSSADTHVCHAANHAMPLPSNVAATVSIPSIERPLPFKTPIHYDDDFKYTLYSDKGKVWQANLFEKLSVDHGRLVEIMKHHVFWLDICHPKYSDMKLISSIFNIHPLTIEDIQVLDPREKVDFFDAYIFLCLRTCDQDVSSRGFLEPTNLYIIVFDHCIISIHEKPLDHIRKVLERIDRSDMSITSDWVMYALLDDIVDGFMPNMKTMEIEVDSIDDLVLVLKESDQTDMLVRIGKARKRVTAMLRLLSPKVEVIKSLVKRDPKKLNPYTVVYIRDIQDHVLTMTQSLDHFGETLNRSHSNYLAQISIELTQASNRTNQVVKKLTVAASLFLPLTVVAGIMGMNVPVPFQVNTTVHDYGPFFTIVGVMVCFVIGLLFIFKNKVED